MQEGRGRSRVLLLSGSPSQAPPPLQAREQLGSAGAGGHFRKRFGRQVGWGGPDCCLSEEWIRAAYRTFAGYPRRTPSLPAFLRAMVATGLSGDPPHSALCGGEKARRVGGGLALALGLGDRSRASERSCSRASNSNHPDPSVNPNLLTLTTPDKGGLTNLNLREGLAFPPSLTWSPVAQAPNLAVPTKCQHLSLPEVPVPQSTLCTWLHWPQCMGISQGDGGREAMEFSFKQGF